MCIVTKGESKPWHCVVTGSKPRPPSGSVPSVYQIVLASTEADIERQMSENIKATQVLKLSLH